MNCLNVKIKPHQQPSNNIVAAHRERGEDIKEGRTEIVNNRSKDRQGRNWVKMAPSGAVLDYPAHVTRLHFPEPYEPVLATSSNIHGSMSRITRRMTSGGICIGWQTKGKEIFWFIEATLIYRRRTFARSSVLFLPLFDQIDEKIRFYRRNLYCLVINAAKWAALFKRIEKKKKRNIPAASDRTGIPLLNFTNFESRAWNLRLKRINELVDSRFDVSTRSTE